MTVDTVFALMGPTGSGKSNFIHQLTGNKKEKGANGLTSCTQGITEFAVMTSKGRYVFVDTPGFDDTYRSDRDILRTIADWLEEKYKKEVKLRGVIYTHRITDNRMSGSVCKNLDMFGRLCGDKAASRVRLVTTMWDKAKNRHAADSRVPQLENEFWKPLIDEGARHLKFDNTPKSAWDIINDLTGQPVTVETDSALLLQEELVDAKKKLNETNAGKALYSQFEKLLLAQKEAMKQLSDEAKTNDPNLARELEEEYKRIEAQLQKTMEEMDKLKIPLLRRLRLLFARRTRSHVIQTNGS